MANDELIRSLAEDGRLDSSGQFTLDLARGAAKLRNRLLQPEDAPLYLVQSAVASGATRLSITCRGGEMVLQHDGYFPRSAEIGGILDRVVSGAADPPQQRFGLALAAALTPPGQGADLYLSDGQKISFRSHRVEVLEGDSGPPRLRIPLKAPWWRRFMGSNHSVQRVLDRCRYAPLGLSLDWEDLKGYGPGLESAGLHLLQIAWPCPSDRAGLALPKVFRAALQRDLEPARTIARGKVTDRLCGAAATQIENVRNGRLDIVQFGVQLSPVPLPGQPYWIILDDPAFPTDLSQLKPVAGPDLRLLQEFFCGELDRLRAEAKAAHRRSGSSRSLYSWLINDQMEDTGHWKPRHWPFYR